MLIKIAFTTHTIHKYMNAFIYSHIKLLVKAEKSVKEKNNLSSSSCRLSVMILNVALLSKQNLSLPLSFSDELRNYIMLPVSVQTRRSFMVLCYECEIATIHSKYGGISYLVMVCHLLQCGIGYIRVYTLRVYIRSVISCEIFNKKINDPYMQYYYFQFF